MLIQIIYFLKSCFHLERKKEIEEIEKLKKEEEKKKNEEERLKKSKEEMDKINQLEKMILEKFSR